MVAGHWSAVDVLGRCLDIRAIECVYVGVCVCVCVCGIWCIEMGAHIDSVAVVFAKYGVVLSAGVLQVCVHASELASFPSSPR